MAISTYRELEKYLKQKISEVLVSNVAPATKEVESKNVESKVFDVYDPKIYKRLITGGLSDISNMKTTQIDETTIAISNETPLDERYGVNDTDKSLTEIVVSGEGYMYTGDGTGAYLQPRDFIESTKEEIKQTKLLKNELKQGLNSKGIKTE